MKAAVMRETNAPLVIEDVTIEKPQAGEVLVRTAASGICHSDLHVIEGGLPVPPPCVLGHEPAGVVEAVGEGVTDFAPGDHVIGCISAFCGKCELCLKGKPYLCAGGESLQRPPEEGFRLSAAEIGTSSVMGTTPTSTVVPPRPVIATACWTVGTRPMHSNTTSAPPPVISCTAATGSPSVASTQSVAPSLRARSNFHDWASTAMILPAPVMRAP